MELVDLCRTTGDGLGWQEKGFLLRKVDFLSLDQTQHFTHPGALRWQAMALSGCLGRQKTPSDAKT